MLTTFHEILSMVDVEIGTEFNDVLVCVDPPESHATNARRMLFRKFFTSQKTTPLYSKMVIDSFTL